ncbi:hypothetical protein GC209_13415 [bacterium]|nr:hypothetical protein [bacterium]
MNLSCTQLVPIAALTPDTLGRAGPVAGSGAATNRPEDCQPRSALRPPIIEGRRCLRDDRPFLKPCANITPQRGPIPRFL